MSPVQAAMTTVLLGMSLEQAREVMERPVDGECFWLRGHCGQPTKPGDWLCPQHRAWTPTIATADRGAAR